MFASLDFDWGDVASVLSIRDVVIAAISSAVGVLLTVLRTWVKSDKLSHNGRLLIDWLKNCDVSAFSQAESGKLRVLSAGKSVEIVPFRDPRAGTIMVNGVDVISIGSLNAHDVASVVSFARQKLKSIDNTDRLIAKTKGDQLVASLAQDKPGSHLPALQMLKPGCKESKEAALKDAVLKDATLSHLREYMGRPDHTSSGVLSSLSAGQTETGDPKSPNSGTPPMTIQSAVDAAAAAIASSSKTKVKEKYAAARDVLTACRDVILQKGACLSDNEIIELLMRALRGDSKGENTKSG